MYYKEQEIRKKFIEYLPNCIGQRLGDIYDSTGDENERFKGYKPFVKNYFSSDIGEAPDDYKRIKNWSDVWRKYVNLLHNISIEWFTKEAVFHAQYILNSNGIGAKCYKKWIGISDNPIALCRIYIETVVGVIVDQACMLDYETDKYKNFYNPDSIITQEIINDLIEKIKTQTSPHGDWGNKE
tara:strand:+ start:151 stop:699 length:549 start_codon:yes stop_codon:yes gene_type:complete